MKSLKKSILHHTKTKICYDYITKHRFSLISYYLKSLDKEAAFDNRNRVTYVCIFSTIYILSLRRSTSIRAKSSNLDFSIFSQKNYILNILRISEINSTATDLAKIHTKLNPFMHQVPSDWSPSMAWNPS